MVLRTVFALSTDDDDRQGIAMEIWDREELYKEIWEQQMSRLAPEYGISGVMLGKVCHKLKIPVPGRGY